MNNIITGVKRFMKDEEGLTTAEWVILASAVTVAAIAIVGLIMPKIRDMANRVGTELNKDPYDPSTSGN